MNIEQWILTIILGAIMGLLGQAVRVIVGLKKLQDQAAVTGQRLKEAFDTPTLVVSLLIGSVAGALASFVVLKPDATVTPNLLLGIAGAGYSGADFIEGFMSKYLPTAATTPMNLPQSPSGMVPQPAPAPGAVTALAQGSAPVTLLPPH